MTYTTSSPAISKSRLLFMDYILLFLNDIHNNKVEIANAATIVYGLYFTFFE